MIHSGFPVSLGSGFGDYCPLCILHSLRRNFSEDPAIRRSRSATVRRVHFAGASDSTVMPARHKFVLKRQMVESDN